MRTSDLTLPVESSVESSDTQDRLISIAEVSELLGVTPSTAKKLCGDYFTLINLNETGVRPKYGVPESEVLNFIDTHLADLFTHKGSIHLAEWMNINDFSRGIDLDSGAMAILNLILKGVKDRKDIVELLIDGLALTDLIRDFNMKFKMKQSHQCIADRLTPTLE